MNSFCCTINNVKNTFNPDEFAVWLNSAYERSHFKSWEAVVKAVKLKGGSTSRSSLSRYAGAKNQTIPGKPSQPEAGLAISLAKVFNEDENRVLLLTGHAPVNPDFFPRILWDVDFSAFNENGLQTIKSYVEFTKQSRPELLKAQETQSKDEILTDLGIGKQNVENISPPSKSYDNINSPDNDTLVILPELEEPELPNPLNDPKRAKREGLIPSGGNAKNPRKKRKA
jgi:hypothetical protein